MQSRTYLVVEPDRAYAQLLTDALQELGEINVVDSAQSAIDWLDQPDRHVDSIVMELLLGERSGVEIINELRSHYDWRLIPIVIHTRATMPRQLTSAALRAYGVSAVIRKGPGSLDKLRDSLNTRQLA